MRRDLEVQNSAVSVLDEEETVQQRNVAVGTVTRSRATMASQGIVAKSGSGSDSVRRARHRVESLPMASLPWRYHSLVCAVVPEVSDLIGAHGRDGARTWSAHALQLHLALGSNLWAGTGQAQPLSPKRTNKSYRVDETYIRIKGQDRYLYRAVHSTGQTIDFLLAAKRDAAAAKRFL